MNEDRHSDLPLAEKFKLLPLLGSVACGVPEVSREYLEDLLVAPGQIVDRIESAFLLRVRGDVMSGDGIMPRDLVIVAPTRLANDGDLVIALLGEEALLGRFRKTLDGFFVAPSNPAYSPIKIWREDSTIIGKVIGLIRNYGGAGF